MNRTEFLAKMKAIGDVTTEQRAHIACSLLGHSRIQKNAFFYFYCARCGDQLGDQLGSAYDARAVVIVGHDCDTCRTNYKALTWRDKIYAPDPFKPEAK